MKRELDPRIGAGLEGQLHPVEGLARAREAALNGEVGKGAITDFHKVEMAKGSEVGSQIPGQVKEMEIDSKEEIKKAVTVGEGAIEAERVGLWKDKPA